MDWYAIQTKAGAESATPLTKELLSYWIGHQDATGTFESIVEWWLLEYRIQQAVAGVRSMLAELVETNFVLEQRQPGGRPRCESNAKRKTGSGHGWNCPFTTGCPRRSWRLR